MTGSAPQSRSRIAVSGHRGLPTATAGLVSEAIREALRSRGPVTGLTCLADGADQLFARAVLEIDGQIEVIVPASQYRDGLPGDALAEYDALLARAAAVRQLPYTESTPEAHMAASRLMVDQADELVAVWDGQPARAYGGTADVVAYARLQGTPIVVIWPAGAERTL